MERVSRCQDGLCRSCETVGKMRQVHSSALWHRGKCGWLLQIRWVRMPPIVSNAEVLFVKLDHFSNSQKSLEQLQDVAGKKTGAMTWIWIWKCHRSMTGGHDPVACLFIFWVVSITLVHCLEPACRQSSRSFQWRPFQCRKCKAHQAPLRSQWWCQSIDHERLPLSGYGFTWDWPQIWPCEFGHGNQQATGNLNVSGTCLIFSHVLVWTFLLLHFFLVNAVIIPYLNGHCCASPFIAFHKNPTRTAFESEEHGTEDMAYDGIWWHMNHDYSRPCIGFKQLQHRHIQEITRVGVAWASWWACLLAQVSDSSPCATDSLLWDPPNEAVAGFSMSYDKFQTWNVFDHVWPSLINDPQQHLAFSTKCNVAVWLLFKYCGS